LALYPTAVAQAALVLENDPHSVDEPLGPSLQGAVGSASTGDGKASAPIPTAISKLARILA
jgi:hypothetical protein